MKNKLIVLVLFFSFSVFAQNWIWQNPLPQGKTLNDVQILNANYIFAVGDFGSFVKSVDGGVSWSIVNTGKLYNFNAVYALSESNIWIACEGGRLLHTQDGGNNLAEIKIDLAGSINDIIFTDNLTGFAIGNHGLFLKTNDGGLTWIKQIISSSVTFSKIFIHNNKFYLIGEAGTLLISADGSNNWNNNLLTNNILTDITAVNDVIFAAGQNGTILKSVDNGITFNKLSTTFTNWIQSIKFFDANYGIAVGYPGIILTTSDGGGTWTKNEAGKLFKLNSIASFDSSAWLVGERGMILHTINNGLSFEFKSSGKYSKINDIHFFNENTGLVIGNDGLILKTTDGGNTWEQVESGVIENLNDIFFYTEDVAWIAADKGKLLKSVDKGATWTVIRPNPTNDSKLNCVYITGFLSVACGQGGTFYVSSNKGNTWTSVGSGSNYDYYFAYPQWQGRRGLIVGDRGTMMVYFMVWKGFTTQIINDFPDYSFTNIFYTDLKNGWIIGQDGIVLRTRATTSFFEATMIDINQLNGIHMIDTSNGYVVGSAGSVFRTNDGGFNWTRQDIGITNTLNKIYFVNQSIGWIIGADGLIMKTTNFGGGTILNVEENKLIAEDFSLAQNYPNPFNPSTTISFTLPERTEVSLKVYNILGKEVAALVNETKEQGKHSINFDASKLSSGIYFYELRAGSKVFTRKMTLLK
ncbi:MAG TPA: YCF48-related protein [Ignavibacteriaceae bacterium]|nr:YCF48-related protein [Ignavibacteriaceae bacterium]